MSIKDIRALFQRCIYEDIPYCYGRNNLHIIDLKEMYVFQNTSADKNLQNKPYTLVGFDCSGILHFISNGNLPHRARSLAKCGKKMFSFSPGTEYSFEQKQDVLKSLQDTDYLVFAFRKDTHEGVSGHLVVSYNGGFLEFKGKDYGVVYTSAKNAMQKLESMMAYAKKSNLDLIVVRWHPELLKKHRQK